MGLQVTAIVKHKEWIPVDEYGAGKNVLKQANKDMVIDFQVEGMFDNEPRYKAPKAKPLTKEERENWERMARWTDDKVLPQWFKGEPPVQEVVDMKVKTLAKDLASKMMSGGK